MLKMSFCNVVASLVMAARWILSRLQNDKSMNGVEFRVRCY